MTLLCVLQLRHFDMLWICCDGFAQRICCRQQVARQTDSQQTGNSGARAIGNESVPIQLTQCRFPGLAISNGKKSMYFSNKIYGSNLIKQQSETVMV